LLEGPKLRQLYKERTMEIETTRQDFLRKKIQENERKKDKNRKEKELIRDYRNNSTIIWLTISIFSEIVPYTFPMKDRLV
jgi:uncharacterized protein involved in exopolysaccharide biosynthesis